jgi:hypothetical protein
MMRMRDNIQSAADCMVCLGGIRARGWQPVFDEATKWKSAVIREERSHGSISTEVHSSLGRHARSLAASSYYSDPT